MYGVDDDFWLGSHHDYEAYSMMTSSQSLRTVSNVAVGPVGRAKAEDMSPELLEALQQHLNMERQAHAAYFAAAIWFAERELRGFASYFRQESQSEHNHAAKFGEYLIARGQTVELHTIEAPRQSWKSPEEIMATSFLLEADVTTSLHQLYAIAERSNDVRTTVFLDPMVEKQVEAEHEFAHLLGRVRFANDQAAALLILDNELLEGRHAPATLQTDPA